MEVLKHEKKVICMDRKYTINLPKKVLIGLGWIKINGKEESFDIEVIPNLKDGTITLRKWNVKPIDSAVKYMDRVMAWLHLNKGKKAIAEIREK